MARILEEGPIRKMLRGWRHFASPQQKIPYEKLVVDIALLTGLSERNAMDFLRTVGSDPYLYVFYDETGGVVDWDFAASEEEITYKAKDRFRRRPEFKSYRFFKASVEVKPIAVAL